MRTSYAKEDVCFLPKDITGLVGLCRQRSGRSLFEKGMHYCEMLPIEYEPEKPTWKLMIRPWESYAGAVARAVGVLADKIIDRKGRDVVLVSRRVPEHR